MMQARVVHSVFISLKKTTDWIRRKFWISSNNVLKISSQVSYLLKNPKNIIDSIEIPFFSSDTKSWTKALSKNINLNVNKSTIFDISDKELLNSNTNLIRYIRVGEQNWISSSTVKIQNSIFYILFIALILFIIPYFESSFRNLKRYINHYTCISLIVCIYI